VEFSYDHDAQGRWLLDETRARGALQEAMDILYRSDPNALARLYARFKGFDEGLGWRQSSLAGTLWLGQQIGISLKASLDAQQGEAGSAVERDLGPLVEEMCVLLRVGIERGYAALDTQGAVQDVEELIRESRERSDE
jgi:hypothetical protein